MPARATTFADVLRRTRLRRGMTQEELAERAGLSVRGISDLERGVNSTPRRDTKIPTTRSRGIWKSFGRRMSRASRSRRPR